MVATNFAACLARLLAHEGGYSDLSADPGGPTNRGITIADYRRYVKADATPADLRTMSADTAGRIYRAHYWDALRCDDLPAGVDYAVFDYGVNSGTGRSGKVLRRLLGLSDATSRVDDAVVAAACATDAARLVDAICDERLHFLTSLKTWGTFGRGWGTRVAEVRRAALALAAAAVAPPVPPAPVKRKALQTTAAIAAAGGVAAVTAQSHAAELWWLTVLAFAATVAAIVVFAVLVLQNKN